MERLGGSIERELSRSGSRGALPLAALTAAWPSIVGDAIARNAWPLRIGRDGTLHVATASATWAQELALLSGELLERLRATLGEEAPARLRCAVGPIPETEQPAETPPKPIPDIEEMPSAVRSEAASAASAIADPELRELVARAARASLLKTRSGRSF
jgi:hypothetical protein